MIYPRCVLPAVTTLTVLASGSLPATAQLRIVNYNIAQRNGADSALQEVFASLNDDDKSGFATAPHVYVMQEVRSSDRFAILDMLNAEAPAGVTYDLGTFTSIGGEDGSGGAQALYYRDDVLVEIISVHQDIFTGAGRYADRWKLQLLDYDSLTASFYIYSAHLKAGDSSADEDQRESGAQAIRDNADTLPAGTHIIFAGDFNMSSNTEAGYLVFVGPGQAQAFDPLGTGSWTGPGGAAKHTQSPRTTGGALIGGGMDDRFDFQLSAGELHDLEGLSLMSGTYRAAGNDGFHYNQAINDGNNFYYPGDVPRSNALADALHDASDHLPVIAEYQVPAVMTATMLADFGQVIQNAEFELELQVTNAAEVLTPQGADVLDYTALAVGVISGLADGSVQALVGPDSVFFPVDTTTVGDVNGAVLLSSSNEAVQVETSLVATAGTVLRPSNASFSDLADVDSEVLEGSFDPDSGVHNLEINIYNFGYDAQQALLDLDAVGPPEAPFAFVGGLAGGIGAAAATLSFEIDTAGLAPGEYQSEITIDTSDQDVPGETTSALTLTLAATISGGIPADLNGDGFVGSDDLALLLGSWGACPGCAADLTGDGVVGSDDLALLLGSWT